MRKMEYSRLYTQAQLIGIAVACYNPISDKSTKFPKIENVFPDLFEAEPEKEQDWRIMKDRLMTFMTGHNKQREVEDNA